MQEDKVNAFCDAVREALRAENMAGVAHARYIHDDNSFAGMLDENRALTRKAADIARQEMWSAFYDMMDKDNQ